MIMSMVGPSEQAIAPGIGIIKKQSGFFFFPAYFEMLGRVKIPVVFYELWIDNENQFHSFISTRGATF